MVLVRFLRLGVICGLFFSNILKGVISFYLNERKKRKKLNLIYIVIFCVVYNSFFG